MTELLQKLLNDRDVVLLLYQKWFLCSCGEKFDEYNEAENHLVLKHQRRKTSITDHQQSKVLTCSNRSVDNYSSIAVQLQNTQASIPKDTSPPIRTTGDSLGENRKLLVEHLQCIKTILEEGQHKCRCDQRNSITRSVNDIKLIPKKSFNSPFASQKIVPVVLEEDQINSGNVQDIECFECRKNISNFEQLKEHYSNEHSENWTYDSNEIISRKPKAFLGGWNYRYYCPIPGCVHHILNCLEPNGETINTKVVDTENENEAKTSNLNTDVNDAVPKQESGAKIKSKHFPHITALKQHYSKVHAYRGLACEVCESKNAVFATAGQLEKHKRTLCGKEFICTTCRRQYGGLEHLQTHCRRKGHTLPAHLFNHIKNKRSNLHAKSDNVTQSSDPQGYIMYRPPAMTTNATYSQLSQPFVLNVMPSNIIVPQVTSISTPSGIQSEITKRKVEEDSLETPKDKTVKRIFVKIAPKPMVYNPQRLLDTVSSDSKSSILSQNNILLGSAAESLASVSHSHPNEIHSIRGNANLANITTALNTRPHCPVQLSAAIALSELAAKTEEGSVATIHEDHSNENFVLYEGLGHPGSKLPAEIEETHASTSKRFKGPETRFMAVGTSTDDSSVDVRDLMITNKPLTNTLHVQCPEWTNAADVGCLITEQHATEEQETQTFCSDKLLSHHQGNTLLPSWRGVAATQTSPGDVRLSDVVESASDLLSCFADASTATSPEPKPNEDDSLLRPFQRVRSRPFPKLGDIEQFSTETQTDDFDLLKIAASEEASVRGEDKMVDEEDDPFSSFKRQLIEATTQFDLDDILCSNYTQTCPELLGSEDDDPMMNMLVRPTDAENNSVRNNIGIKSNKISSSSSHTSITTESQTQTSRYFGYEDIEKETNQISMDIETQTSTMI